MDGIDSIGSQGGVGRATISSANIVLNGGVKRHQTTNFAELPSPNAVFARRSNSPLSASGTVNPRAKPLSNPLTEVLGSTQTW